jgi:hypothetical protein
VRTLRFRERARLAAREWRFTEAGGSPQKVGKRPSQRGRQRPSRGGQVCRPYRRRSCGYIAFDVLWSSCRRACGRGHRAHCEPIAGFERYPSTPDVVPYEEWLCGLGRTSSRKKKKAGLESNPAFFESLFFPWIRRRNGDRCGGWQRCQCHRRSNGRQRTHRCCR